MTILNPCYASLLIGALLLAVPASAPGGEGTKAPGGLERVRTTASTVVTTEAVTPAVAMDREGGIYVVYFDRKTRNVLLAVSKDGGKTFAPPVTALDTGGRGEAGAQRGPRVGVDSRKSVYVSACLKPEKPIKHPYDSDVVIARSRDGGKTFDPPLRVNDAPGSAPEMYQALAVEPGGDAHLAWLDLRREPDLRQMIYTARVSPGEGGKLAVRKNVEVYVSPSGSVCECCEVGIAAPGGGKVAIAFRNSLEDGSRDAFLSLSSDGGAAYAPAVKVGRGIWKAPG